MISEPYFASCPAAALSPWSFAIADGEGVSITGSFGGVRSSPAMAAPAVTISATGSDMAVQLTGPGDRWKLLPPPSPTRVFGSSSAPPQNRPGPRWGRDAQPAAPARAG